MLYDEIVIYKCSNNIRRCSQPLFVGFSQYSPVLAFLRIIIVIVIVIIIIIINSMTNML